MHLFLASSAVLMFVGSVWLNFFCCLIQAISRCDNIIIAVGQRREERGEIVIVQ